MSGPPPARSNRLSPSVTMSRPAASWALMTHATASRYCSRKSESPSADLNERPRRLSLNQSGRGYDPVMAVGSIRSRVTLSIDSSQTQRPLSLTCSCRRLHREKAEAVVPGDVLMDLRRKPEGAQCLIHRLLGRHVGVVRPDEDLPGPDHVDQIAKRPPVEEQCVVVEAAGVLGRRARQGARRGGAAALTGRVLVPGPAPRMVVARKEEGEGAAAVAEGDPQARAFLRRSSVDHRRDGQAGVRGVADGVEEGPS